MLKLILFVLFVSLQGVQPIKILGCIPAKLKVKLKLYIVYFFLRKGKVCINLEISPINLVIN